MESLNVNILCVSLLLEDRMGTLSLMILFFFSDYNIAACSAGLKSLYLVCGSAAVGFMSLGQAVQ